MAGMRNFLLSLVVFLAATAAGAQSHNSVLPSGKMPVAAVANEPACNNGQKGSVYYDSTNDLLKYCDGSSFQTIVKLGDIGDPMTVGTADTVVKFNAGATDLADSDMVNVGFPAALASGDVFSISGTAANPGAGNTVSALRIAPDTDDVDGGTFAHLIIDDTGHTNKVAEILRGILFISGSGYGNHIQIEEQTDGINLILRSNAAQTFQVNADATSGDAWNYHLDVGNAAGSSGSWLNFQNISIAAMDDSADEANIINFASAQIVSGDHTAGTVSLLNVENQTNDPDATYVLLNIGTGWDSFLYYAPDGTPSYSLTIPVPTLTGYRTFEFGDESVTFGSPNDDDVLTYDLASRTWSAEAHVLPDVSTITSPTIASWTFTTPTANSSILDFILTVPITAAGQTTNVIDLSLTNANHTGGTVNAFNIGAITGDAQSTENAINIGSGWDTALNVLADGSATTNNICMGAGGCAADASMYFDGSALNITLPGTNDFIVDVGQSANALIRLGDVSNNLSIVTGAASSSGQIFYEFQITQTVGIGNGSDTYTLLKLDWNDATVASGTGNTLQALFIDPITPDVDVSNYAIVTGSGWDAFMVADADADGWTAPDNPPTNSVALYIDESGANCNLVARLSSGTEIVVSALVVAGGCP